VTTALSLPFIGRLIDRYGARRVLIPSLVLFAGCLAAIPLFVRELWQLNLIYVLMGSIAAGTNSTPFVRVISAWFDRSRGLAIGIAGSGTGLGFAYVPLVVEYMTTHHGWRSAYYALAAIVLALTLPLVWMLFKERPADVGLSVDGTPLATPSFGRRRARERKRGLHTARGPRKARLLGADDCVRRSRVCCLWRASASRASAQGPRHPVGARRADRLDVRSLGIRRARGDRLAHRSLLRTQRGARLLCAVRCRAALLNTEAPVWLYFVAAALVGGGLGAEVDLLAYLTSRYFGLRCFSEIFGVLFGAILVSIGLGPVVFGLVHDRTQSYTAVMYAGIGLCVVAVLVMVLLRPYPQWGRRQSTHA
jgi:MFS family permease